MVTEVASMTIGVITPTYLRTRFLWRFLRTMPRQTYPDWRLLVVHDGPNPAVEALVDQARDPRIGYAHTERKTNDYGVSPRLEGLRRMIGEVGPEYCVFWDDDNLFSRHALRRIVDALDQGGRPDLLLVPIRNNEKILPPSGFRSINSRWATSTRLASS
jgi:hypothetical protein